MKDSIKLEAKERKITGKEVSSIREEGFIPSAIFGINGNKNISLDKKIFLKVFEKAKYTSVIELSAGDTKHNVLISEIQTHPVTNDVLTVTFHEISLKEKVNTNVPIELEGEAPAVKTYNGILVHSLQEIEISALPGNIPQSIVIDINKLEEIGDSILIKDISLPEGVELVSDDEETLELAIVTVAPPTEEVEEEAEEEVSPEDVEVINEKKEEESTED
jgi:large subunit ribosomal protein L25